MAGFKTHITVSTALGVTYGSVACLSYNIDPPTCILAGAMCSVSGMLPDLDSDTGTPLKEAVHFGSAVIPMVLLRRFVSAGISHETMILAALLVYLFIRFVFANILRQYTVHRGMFHSVPALAIAAGLTFLLCDFGSIEKRYFMAGGVALGFMSHLVLDEIWAVDFKHARLKSSFGTAIKFWGQNLPVNLLVYGILAAVSFAAMNDPDLATQLNGHSEPAEQIANSNTDSEQR